MLEQEFFSIHQGPDQSAGHPVNILTVRLVKLLDFFILPACPVFPLFFIFGCFLDRFIGKGLFIGPDYRFEFIISGVPGKDQQINVVDDFF